MLKAPRSTAFIIADPRKDKKAKRYDALSYRTYCRRSAGDGRSAISLARENRIPIIVFDIHSRARSPRRCADRALSRSSRTRAEHEHRPHGTRETHAWRDGCAEEGFAGLRPAALRSTCSTR